MNSHIVWLCRQKYPLISSPLASDLGPVASGTARQHVSRSKKEFWGPPLGLESWTSRLSAASPQSTSGGSSEWICTQKVKGWSPSSVAEQLTRSSHDCLSEKTTLDTREDDDSWELKVLSGEEIEQDASLDTVEVKEDFCWSCFSRNKWGWERKRKNFHVIPVPRFYMLYNRYAAEILTNQKLIWLIIHPNKPEVWQPIYRAVTSETKP